MGTFNSGKGDPALLPAARQSALKLLELMLAHKPFSYLNGAVLRGLIEKAFVPNSVKIANAFIQAQRTGKLTEQLEGQYEETSGKYTVSQLIVNKNGEVGNITTFDGQYITVAYNDRTAMFMADAFEKGHIRYLNEDLQKKAEESIAQAKRECAGSRFWYRVLRRYQSPTFRPFY